MRVNAKILSDYIKGTGVKHKETPGSFIFTCPNCNKSEKLWIRKYDGHYICWSCATVNETKGNRPEFILNKILRVPIKEITAKLYGTHELQATEYLDIQIDGMAEEDEFFSQNLIDLPSIEWPMGYYPLEHSFSTRGVDYLAGRGIPIEIGQKYKLRYCPTARRVSFPAEYQNKLYGYQDRLIIPHEWIDPETGELKKTLKIKSSKAVIEGQGWRERTLMFMDNLTQIKFEHTVLCEGPVDAIKADLCGGAVCTMGKAVSPYQVQILKRLGVKRAYLGLDPDAADEMAELVKNMTAEMDLYLLELPTVKDKKIDLGALELQEVYELFKTAKQINSNHLFIYIKLPSLQHPF
jgi:hypothetical protein